MRKLVFGAVLGVLVLSNLSPATAQPDLEGAEVTSQKVTEGIYMLTGGGGNIGLAVGEDGVFMIDDDYAPMTEKVRKAVQKITDQPVRFVLNTHWHGDHTGGNESLGKTGALILAHENVRKRLSTEQFITAFQLEVPASPKVALPVVTYEDRVTLHLNGDEIHAFHVAPAHTDGDSVVHFRKAGVIHTGDLFFNGIYPFIDVSSGGGIDGVIAAVEELLGIVGPETKIIPGHGPLSNREELMTYLAMLKTVRENVATLIETGKTLEEVVAAKPTAPLDETWGDGFLEPDVFVGIVYSSLK